MKPNPSNQKSSNLTSRNLLRAAFLIIFLVISFAVSSRARTITLSLEFTRIQFSTFDQYNPGQTYYTVKTLVSSDIPPITYDEADSSTNNSAFGGSQNGYGYGYYSDIASALHDATNGAWTLTVNKGDVSQKQYTFTVSATGLPLANSSFPAVQITTPADGSPAVSTNSSFAWSGPATWDELDLDDHTADYSFYTSDSPSPDTTTWNPAPLALGTNFFEVTYKTNASVWITISTPLDNLSHPFTNWVGGAKLVAYDESGFVTSTNPATLVGGHTLIAHYTFDNSGDLGQDSSGHGNDLSGASWWGTQQVFSANAEAGDGAVKFFGTSSLTPNGQSLTNLNAVLSGDFTFSAWVNTTDSAGNDGDDAVSGATIFWSYNDHNNTNDTIPLAITGSKAAFSTRDHLGNTTTIHSLTSVNDGNYHQITVTRRQTDGRMDMYVDGNLEASTIGTTDPLNGNNYYLSVGGSTISSYTGLLDDLQVYSGVLSDGEAAQLHSNPGTTVPDISGNSQDLNTALGSTNLNWTTSGDSTWFVETTNTYNSSPAATQSGSVINNQSSTLSVAVTGPGTLTFYWASQDDCNNFDYQFAIDGSEMNDISCSQSWEQAGPYTISAGQHTLSWTTYAYGDTDPTEAGFLDQVSFMPDTAPVITLNPFSQTNSPGYNVALFAAATNSFNTPITWQWFEVGNSSPIANATNTLFIPATSGTAGVAGSYYAVASTPGGSVNTTTATVAFVTAPLPPAWSHAVKSPFQAVDATTFTKDYYVGCVVDAAGDVYAAAQFNGNMDVYTNGITENVLTAPGSSGAALAKHAANGSPLWAVGLTNNQTGSSYGIAVAAGPGNGAYLSANCSGTNWLGTNQFVDVGGNSILLSRFDVNGSNVWSKFIGGTNYVYTSYNMVVSDSSGNVTLVGNLTGTVSFGGTNLSAPSGGGFMVQYDSTGGVRWAQTIPNNISGLAYGGGRLYASLQTTISGGVTNVSISSLSNLTDRSWAVACLNTTNGQALWLRGVGDEYGTHPVGIANDEPIVSVAGTNVFLLANAYGASIQFGNLSVPLPGGSGQYFARYDTNGNPQTASVFGSASTMIWAVAANATGVYVCGDFDYYSQFGSAVIAAPVLGQNDLDLPQYGIIYYTQPFVAKFDANGNALWARNGVSSDFANFRGIATTSDGVWAAGFLKITNSVPAQFGTNSVYSDLQIINGNPFSYDVWNQAGMLAKITDGTAAATSVTLLNPQTVGANFQFQFLSEAGFTHNILYRTNLTVGTWLTNSIVTGNGTVTNISVPYSIFSPARQGFIRVSTQ